MGISSALTMGMEGIISIFIFLILFGALLPSIIDTINNTSGLGLPQVTILIVSLLGLIFVVGVFMRVYKTITEPDRPEIQY
jgi:F0F1-type ATP synthase assembly protein I